jgi:transposase-like protein
MSGKQAGEERVRRSRAEVAQLVGEYEASGLSRQEFCRKHGLALSTLQRHQKRRQQARKAARDSRFVTVELSSAESEDSSRAGSELTVVLSGGRRIEVKPGFEANMLQQLIRLLEQI